MMNEFPVRLCLRPFSPCASTCLCVGCAAASACLLLCVLPGAAECEALLTYNTSWRQFRAQSTPSKVSVHVCGSLTVAGLTSTTSHDPRPMTADIKNCALRAVRGGHGRVCNQKGGQQRVPARTAIPACSPGPLAHLLLHTLLAWLNFSVLGRWVFGEGGQEGSLPIDAPALLVQCDCGA